MADAFRKPGGGGLDINAMQHLMEQHAVDAAPDPAQLERRRVPQLLDGEDARAVQPLLHAPADAIDILQLKAEQNFGQVVLGDDYQPVRLLQIGADHAEKHIRRDADRTGQALADLIAQRSFDLEREFTRGPLSPEEIRELREREGASQAVFARYLNVTTGLVSQWERGEKHPQGA